MVLPSVQEEPRCIEADAVVEIAERADNPSEAVRVQVRVEFGEDLDEGGVPDRRVGYVRIRGVIAEGEADLHALCGSSALGHAL